MNVNGGRQYFHIKAEFLVNVIKRPERQRLCKSRSVDI